jgi:ABC-type amino acid transport substrate-binding protein
MAFRSPSFLVLLACAVASASNYQLNDALSAAIASVNISATYVDYFGSAPAFYPPACSIDWPTVTSGSDLESVIKNKALRLGYSEGGNTPFVIEGSKISGFDVEYASLIVASLNEHYSSDVSIEWIPLPITSGFFSGLSAGLNNGDVDAIMSGITNNADRALVVQFTCNYFPSTIGGLTTDQDLTTYASLNQSSVTIGYQTGTISAILVQQLTQATTVAASSTLEGLALVENGTVDYFIMAQPQALYLAQSRGGSLLASPFVFPNSESFMSVGTVLPTEEPISSPSSSTPSTSAPAATPTKTPGQQASSATRASSWLSLLLN